MGTTYNKITVISGAFLIVVEEMVINKKKYFWIAENLCIIAA